MVALSVEPSSATSISYLKIPEEFPEEETEESAGEFPEEANNDA